MNDIEEGINWSKISKIIPHAKKTGSDRAPTVEEIRLMLKAADTRTRCVIPLFAGALKGYSVIGIVRILARFAAPTSSALLITYVVLYHGLLLSPFGITFDDSPDQGFAIPITMSFVALLWFLFYGFVSFGENIGQEEDTGLRADGNQITQQVNHIITPTLDSFVELIRMK